MRRDALRALKIIAIGDGFAAAPNQMAVNCEKFRIVAGLPALGAGPIHAFFSGINAAAKFKIAKSAPVWLPQGRAAVEQLGRVERRLLGRCI